MTSLMKGIVLGLSIAAPVGPIGLLCIRKTLTQGRSFGFTAGMGAATADVLYGSIAALGLTVISQFLIRQSDWLHMLGAIFLFYLAYRGFKDAVQPGGQMTQTTQGYVSTYAATFLLTLANPMTIVSFIGIFAGMNLETSSRSSLFLVLGVFIGSSAWWLLLTTAVGFSRKMIGSTAMKRIHYVSSIVLLGFGVYSVYNVVS